MKRVLAVLFACLMVVGLMGCAAAKEPTQPTQSTDTKTEESSAIDLFAVAKKCDNTRTLDDLLEEISANRIDYKEAVRTYRESDQGIGLEKTPSFIYVSGDGHTLALTRSHYDFWPYDNTNFRSVVLAKAFEKAKRDIVADLNTELGFDSSVTEQMLKLDEFDGRPSEESGNVVVTWNYDPHWGLVAFYELKD